MPGSLEDAERARDVGLVIGGRVFDRRHDVGERGEMKDPIDLVESLPEWSGGDVGLDHLEIRVVVVVLEVAAVPRAEVVDHRNAVAVAEQSVDEMTSDEPRTSRDDAALSQAPHGSRIPFDSDRGEEVAPGLAHPN